MHKGLHDATLDDSDVDWKREAFISPWNFANARQRSLGTERYSPEQNGPMPAVNESSVCKRQTEGEGGRESPCGFS